MANWLIGVDTGGTFTDLIAFDHASGALRRAKVPSVPGDPSLAVIDALEKLFAEGVTPADIAMIVHGTTVATNALLEGKGVRAGLLITKGFRAVYEARGWSQPRGADLLDTFYQKPPLLVSQYLTEEVVERLDYEGHVVTPLDEDALRASVAQPGRARASMQSPSASCSPSSTRRTSGVRPKSWREEAPGLPHFGLERGAARHPRISAAIDHGDRCLCRAPHRQLSRKPRKPSRRARRHHAAEIPDAVERRADADFARCAPSEPDAAVRARGRRHRRRRSRADDQARPCRHLRHGRHVDRHQRHRRRRHPRNVAGPDRWPGHWHADAARAHAGRGRRHGRRNRQGRTVEGRPAQLGLGAGARPVTDAAAPRRP